MKVADATHTGKGKVSIHDLTLLFCSLKLQKLIKVCFNGRHISEMGTWTPKRFIVSEWRQRRQQFVILMFHIELLL